MKPLIGVPARALNENVDPWLPKRQGIFDAYYEVIEKAGGLPIMIPLTSERSVLNDYFSLVEGILFAGGGDILPEFYEEESRYPLQRSNPLQDKNELILVSWSVLEQKPTLGICRGMQLVNIALGGALHQDLRGEGVTNRDHNESETHRDFARPTHNIVFDAESHLAKLLGCTEGEVNSLHHQGIKELARDLRPVAWAPDMVIEAAEGIHHPYLHLTQFHPEQMAPAVDPRWQRLFDDFVKVSQSQPKTRQAKVSIK